MGLDMFLMARKGKGKFKEVAYWRKVNSVHQWFVDNCQDGEDECRKAMVTREQLQELLSTCKKVKGVKSAEKYLPTQGGFFFGSTEYDEYYFSDIKETVEMLTKILNDEKLKDAEFYYQSSW